MRGQVQYSYCSPSRHSFLTGRRPDTTRVWEFVDHFREKGVGEDWISLPQYFKTFGYLTLGSGKLFHPTNADENIGAYNHSLAHTPHMDGLAATGLTFHRAYVRRTTIPGILRRTTPIF